MRMEIINKKKKISLNQKPKVATLNNYVMFHFYFKIISYRRFCDCCVFRWINYRVWEKNLMDFSRINWETLRLAERLYTDLYQTPYFRYRRSDCGLCQQNCVHEACPRLWTNDKTARNVTISLKLIYFDYGHIAQKHRHRWVLQSLGRTPNFTDTTIVDNKLSANGLIIEGGITVLGFKVSESEFDHFQHEPGIDIGRYVPAHGRREKYQPWHPKQFVKDGRKSVHKYVTETTRRDVFDFVKSVRKPVAVRMHHRVISPAIYIFFNNIIMNPGRENSYGW